MQLLTKYRCCKLFILVGAAVFIAGVVGNGLQLDDIRQLGAIITVGALVRLVIVPATKPHTDMYQSGWDDGYDVGHADGHAAARPVVVPIRLLKDTSELQKHSHN